jgi:hypothetical protein
MFYDTACWYCAMKFPGLRGGAVKSGAATWLLLSSVSLMAQDIDNKAEEPTAIIELGGAASHDLKGGSGYGADFAAEITPIENWLELEAGVTPLFAPHQTEWDADFLFKKPWTISKKLEFMIGIGPEWVHTRQNGISRNAFAAEAILDFMFWPSGRHKFGWYLEPGYDYTFGRDHERSIGITGGLLIGIGKSTN